MPDKMSNMMRVVPSGLRIKSTQSGRVIEAMIRDNASKTAVFPEIFRFIFLFMINKFFNQRVYFFSGEAIKNRTHLSLFITMIK